MSDCIKELEQGELDQVSGGTDMAIWPRPFPPIPLPFPKPPRWPQPIPIPRLPVDTK